MTVGLALLTEAGMKPVTALKQIDGFLLNRLPFTLVAEATHLVGEGHCSAEDIDIVMTQGSACVGPRSARSKSPTSMLPTVSWASSAGSAP